MVKNEQSIVFVHVIKSVIRHDCGCNYRFNEFVVHFRTDGTQAVRLFFRLRAVYWEKNSRRSEMAEYCTVAIDPEQTGHRIALECQNQGLTVRELQDIFGFAAPNAIYRWMHGRRSTASIIL